MFTYAIKENGYQIGVARGKKKAIEHISKLKLKGVWSQDESGNIVFDGDNGYIYSIEQSS